MDAVGRSLIVRFTSSQNGRTKENFTWSLRDSQEVALKKLAGSLTGSQGWVIRFSDNMSLVPLWLRLRPSPRRVQNSPREAKQIEGFTWPPPPYVSSPPPPQLFIRTPRIQISAIDAAMLVRMSWLPFRKPTRSQRSVRWRVTPWIAFSHWAPNHGTQWEAQSAILKFLDGRCQLMRFQAGPR